MSTRGSSSKKKKSKAPKKSSPSKRGIDEDEALSKHFGVRSFLKESDIVFDSDDLVEFDPLVMKWLRRELLRNWPDKENKKSGRIVERLSNTRNEEAVMLLRRVFPAGTSEEGTSPNLKTCANLLVDPSFVPFLLHPSLCLPYLPPLAMERAACRIVMLYYAEGISPVRFLIPALSLYAAHRSSRGESALNALLEYRIMPGTMISELHKWTMRFLAALNMKPLMDELHSLAEAACRKHSGTLEIDHQRFWPNTPSPEAVAARLDSYRDLMRCVIKHLLHDKSLTKGFSTDLRVYIHHISTLGEHVLGAEMSKVKSRHQMREAVRELLYKSEVGDDEEGRKEKGKEKGENGAEEGLADKGDTLQDEKITEEDKIWRLRALISSILIKEMLLQSLVAPSKHFPWIQGWSEPQARAVFLLAHLIDRCISAKLIVEDPLLPFNELILEFSNDWANPIESVHVSPLEEEDVEAWNGEYEHDGPDVPVWFRLPGTEDKRESTAEAFANLFDALGNSLSVHVDANANDRGENSTSAESETSDEGEHSGDGHSIRSETSSMGQSESELVPSYQQAHKAHLLSSESGTVVSKAVEDFVPGQRFIQAINDISDTVVVRLRVNKVVIPANVTGTVVIKLAVVFCEISDVELRRVDQARVDAMVEGHDAPAENIVVQEVAVFKLKKRRTSLEEDCSMLDFLELQVPRSTTQRMLVYIYCLKGDRASMSSTIRGLVARKKDSRTLYKGLLRHTLDSTIIANEFHLGEWVSVVHVDMQENFHSGDSTIGISHGDGGMGMAIPPPYTEPLGRGAVGDSFGNDFGASGDVHSEGFRPPSSFQVHLDVQRCLAL